jgi:hypothetical protein
MLCALGTAYGPQPERGVFRTTDGGATWTKVLFVDENTGATDLVIDPANPQVLYAAMYQHQRRTWGYNGGGPGSNIYKTPDGGATWTKLTTGLPAGDKGRIGLSLYATDPKVVSRRSKHAPGGRASIARSTRERRGKRHRRSTRGPTTTRRSVSTLGSRPHLHALGRIADSISLMTAGKHSPTVQQCAR